jgi:hypothetical protein
MMYAIVYCNDTAVNSDQFSSARQANLSYWKAMLRR